MFEQLKKISFKKSLPFTVLLLIAGIALSLFHIENAFYAITGYADFTVLSPDEIKSQLVDVDLWETYGCYMESGSKNTSTQRVTISHYYYIIYTGSWDDINIPYKYMSIKVPASYESRMESMTENTYNGLITSPITFSGKIRKLDSKENKYFTDFWYESGFTTDDINEMTLPYYIDVTESKPGQQILYIGLFLGGLLLIFWSIFRIFKAASGGYLGKFRKDIALIGCNEYTVESDFNAAAPIAGNKSIKMGRLFTYYDMNSTVPRAIPNTKIAWAYQSTTTHRTNGIKTGTTYAVTIFTDSAKAATNISVANESVAQLILGRLATFCPWIVVGYSDELSKLFARERARFLDLKYNTVEHNIVTPDVPTYPEG